MDGFKKRLNDSIQLQLSIWISLAIVAIAVVAGIASFATAFDEAHELQDDMLRQIAFLSASRGLTISGSGGPENASNEESRFTIQYLEAGASPQAALPLLATLPDGLQTLTLKGKQFRVLVKTLATGKRLAVSQETHVRDEIARHSAMLTVLPFLLLIPLLLFIVLKLVRSVFQPIASLAADIDHRKECDLHPVPENHLATEIRPFVTAINRLFNRVALSINAQRRFVADAAHELRSPLTALSLQSERLGEADMSDTARERLRILRKGIERTRSLLDQLLTLARMQSVATQAASPVSVKRVYQQVLEELIPLAEAKRIDIGIEGEADVQVQVHEVDLRIMVKNLVANAIRYTPEGGRIDLLVSRDGSAALLQIRDSGPGIPIAEQERVFDPFYRVLDTDALGAGLGLSIVKTIADRMGAELHLGYADGKRQQGLSIKIVMPSCRTLISSSRISIS